LAAAVSTATCRPALARRPNDHRLPPTPRRRARRGCPSTRPHRRFLSWSCR